MVETNAIIQISFTAKEQASNKIYETTDEALAKKAGIFDEKQSYGPLTIIAGKGEILKGLDAALPSMKEGDEKHLILEPKEAFGERNQELVRVLPLQEFKNRNVNPVVGLHVNVNDYVGKVQSISGGRVRVDFNPDLAGKTLEYDLKVEKVLATTQAQLDALNHKFFSQANVDMHIKDKNVSITMDVKGALPKPELRLGFAKIVLENIKAIEKVEYIEAFTLDSFKKLESAPNLPSKE